MSYKTDEEICTCCRTDIETNVAQAFQLPQLTTTERDALSAVSAGGLIWNTTTTQVEIYDGAAWEVFALV